MIIIDNLTIWFILLFIGHTSGASFNQPKFCPNASWNPNAATFADYTTIGSKTWDIFITTNNTIYVPNTSNMQMIVWSGNSSTPTRNISLNSTFSRSVFVTEEGDVFFDYTLNSICGIGKWTSDSSSNASIMEACPQCFDIFIDISNYIYCSMDSGHQVIRRSLNTESDPIKIIAGTGAPGSAANMLYYPNDIFVDTDFDLHVVNCWNHRIQLFQNGQTNAMTVAGSISSVATISLSYPTGVAFDADKYLFITDSGNSRIVGSGPNGFQCLVGCSGIGSTAYQLASPKSISFDKFGNIFVVDNINNRIQKFILMANSCNETTASSVNNVTYVSPNTTNIVAVNTTNDISYNQPKFDPYAVWSPNAITLADSSIVGTIPFNICIDKNNTIYLASQTTDRILIWTKDSANPTTIYTNSIYLGSIFVGSNGDIYTGSANSPYNINRWASYKNGSAIAAYIDGICHGVFIDINNTLYFSDRDHHKVLAKPLSSTSNILTIVAGTGCLGNAANMLNWPHGIFIDVNFDLYVADASNNRVQLFQLGQLDAVTVAGSGSTNITITLNTPASVVLDGDKYLFIADFGNNRIVRSGPYGFRCIVGCTGSSGLTPSTLSNPSTMAFDSYGNIYVADLNNNRIQKFPLLSNLVNEMTSEQSTSIEKPTTMQISTVTDLTTSSSSYFASHCSGQNTIGTHCNISASPCDMLNPCENQGTCLNAANLLAYSCLCVPNFNGTRCQYDHRLCKPTTCWNNGICNETSNTTFECLCTPGWTGGHCEKMINYCENIICENKGVCRPLFMNYTCDCLGESFSGRHCEIVARKILLLWLFFVIMDILKYGFGIDPTKDELERIRRAKAIERAKRRRRRRPPVIERFTYVNAPTTEQ